MNLPAWVEFALASAVFALTHFLPVQGKVRAFLIAAMGRRPYFAVYGSVSLLVLIWLIVAAGRAPFVEIWPQTGWSRSVPQIAMPVAVFLAVAGAGFSYPFTLGGRKDRRFDVETPGFAAVTRHPLLWALILWSGAHLPANGDLAHALMFGGFAAMGLLSISTFDNRARGSLSPDEVEGLFRAAPILSARVLLNLKWWRMNARTMTIKLAVSALVFAVLLTLHRPIIGVSPLG